MKMMFLNKLANWYFTRRALPYWMVLLIDCLICYLSGLFVFWLYYRGAVTLGNLGILSKTILLYMVFNLIGFRIFRTYFGIIRYSSFVDLMHVAMAQGVSLIIAEVMHYVVYGWQLQFVRLEGRQIVAMYVVATIGMMIFRVLVKTVYDVVFASDTGQRTLIYGVRDGGAALAKAIRNEKPARFLLKGFISHDKKYDKHRLMGVSVYPADERLGAIIEAQHIKAVLVSPLQVERFRNDTKLQDLLIGHGVHIFMEEPAQRFVKDSSQGSTDALKEVNVEDLLPRDPITVDMPAIGAMLKDKVILITGSAGSIGSEMVRQIAVYHPKNLVLIDQAETPQHDIRLMMHFDYPDVQAETIVTSIAKEGRMEAIFRKYRPQYVFHAAAYKHVPMMEDNPAESVQNNIKGTKVIADLCVKYGVNKMVMISTDKAVNPTNVMGCSKRICEIYCQSLNRAVAEGSVKQENGEPAITQFVTTRFGNVLGSNGSVIPLFRKQIAQGGPVTVTDPRIIRFFMLIPEACKLVLEAGTHGRGGEIFVFDMGKPVRIADLAKRMIMLSGRKDVQIEYVGLRAGEKLYEEVLSNTENTLPSFHPKIRIAKVREYDYAQVERDIEDLIKISFSYDPMAIVKKMKEIVPEFVSNNSVYSVLDHQNQA